VCPAPQPRCGGHCQKQLRDATFGAEFVLSSPSLSSSVFLRFNRQDAVWRAIGRQLPERTYSMTMKLSVIIPAHNEELYMADCLDLVLKNAGNFLHEIIVVAYSDIRQVFPRT
jgi:hypothetical protein